MVEKSVACDTNPKAGRRGLLLRRRADLEWPWRGTALDGAELPVTCSLPARRCGRPPLPSPPSPLLLPRPRNTRRTVRWMSPLFPFLPSPSIRLFSCPIFYAFPARWHATTRAYPRIRGCGWKVGAIIVLRYSVHIRTWRTSTLWFFRPRKFQSKIINENEKFWREWLRGGVFLNSIRRKYSITD